MKNFPRYILLLSLCWGSFAFSQVPVFTPQTGHAFAIKAHDVSSSFKHAVSGDEQGNLIVWEISSQRLIRRLKTQFTDIDYLKCLRVNRTSTALVYSQKDGLFSLHDYLEDTAILNISWNDPVVSTTVKFLTGIEGASTALVAVCKNATYYFNTKTLKIVHVVKHNIKLIASETAVDKYALQLVRVKGTSLEYYNIHKDTLIWKKTISLPLKKNDTIRNVAYRQATTGDYTNLAIVASDSTFFLINPVRGTYVSLTRSLERNNSLMLMWKSRLQAMDDNTYRIEGNQIVFVEEQDVLILGEMMIDLNGLKIKSVNVPLFEEPKSAFKSFSNTSLLIGFTDNTYQQHDLSKFGLQPFGSSSEIFSSVHYNSLKHQFLLVSNSAAAIVDLDKAEVKTMDGVTGNFDYTTVDKTFTYRLEVNNQNSDKQQLELRQLSDNKLITYRTRQSGFVFKPNFVRHWNYVVYLRKNPASKTGSLHVWNTLEDADNEVVNGDVLDYSMNGDGSKITLLYPDRIQIFSFPQFNKIRAVKVRKPSNIEMSLDDDVYLVNEDQSVLKLKGKKWVTMALTEELTVFDKLLKFENGQVGVLYKGVDYWNIDLFNEGELVWGKSFKKARPVDAAVNWDDFSLLVTTNTGENQFIYLTPSKLNYMNVVYTSKPAGFRKYLFYSVSDYKGNLFYAGSKGVQDLAIFEMGNTVVPLSHFDYYFNRPHSVLEKLESRDTAFKELMLTALYKRIYHLKLRDLDKEVQLPTMGDMNDSVIYETRLDTVRFLMDVLGHEVNISEVNVYVNGVPILLADQNYLADYVARLPFKSMSSKTNIYDYKEKIWRNQTEKPNAYNTNTLAKFRFAIDIPLTKGKNILEFYAQDENGLRSIPRSYEIVKLGGKKPKLYVIAMSVSDYQNNDYNLQYARKDGRDLLNHFGSNRTIKTQSMFMQKSQFNVYDTVLVDSLFDNRATRFEFMKLGSILKQTESQDKVILFISGHGVLDDSLDFWFATHDMNFNNPAERGISFDMIEDMLSHIPSRHRLVLMDACHSGEVDKNAKGESAELSETISANFRGASIDGNEPQLGLQNSFNHMKEIFEDVNRGSGIQVVSAAAGDSYALEGEEWNNGVFTYSVLDALSVKLDNPNAVKCDLDGDGYASVEELKRYVSEHVEKSTGGKQKPTSRQGNLEFDYKIW